MRALLLVSLVACKAPEQAPVEFDDLCAFLYAHAWDEDPALLVDGLDNLDAWLADHPEEPLEGYTVADLDPLVVETLPGRVHDLGEVHGAAVLTESRFSVDTLVEPLVVVDQNDVYPGSYALFERSFDGDPDCFAAGDCERLATEAHVVHNFPLGIALDTDVDGQFRWVQTARGEALLNRAWSTRPAEVSVDWLQVDDQFYFSATMPREAGAWRVQVTWVVAELLGGDVPEGTALRMTINGMRKQDERLYAYAETM